MNIYLVSLNNGLSYEDSQTEVIKAFTKKKDALKLVNSEITIDIYKKTFNYSCPDFANPQFYLQVIKLE